MVALSATAIHLVFFAASLAGVVFILPQVSMSLDENKAALYGMSLISGLVFCLAAYFQKIKQIAFAQFMRVLIWFSICVFMVLVLRFNDLSNIEVGMSLALFGLCLLLSGESLFNAGRSFWLRRQDPQLPYIIIPSLTLRVLFSRFNPIGSALDRLELELGIDLKGAWAIAVLRRSAEPMLVAFLTLAWGSTALTVVPAPNSGVREWLGEPEETVLGPGLHVSAPWPFGRIQHVPTERVLSLSIGHEEESGDQDDENILWADQHADAEFTLLLGDGRDLISADGVLNYRIDNVHQYLYGQSSPEKLLSALAYRSLMRETVSRDLNGALSENLDRLAKQVLSRIISQSAAQNLGLKPISFTFSALHPPVGVASDYQKVVSAQIGKETRLIRAQTETLRRLPASRAKAQAKLATARAQSMQRQAEAVGEAQAFLALRSVARSNQELFVFRKRMEAIEAQLSNQDLIIVDRRIEKDGGEVWVEK